MGGQAFLRCYTRPEMPTTSNPALLEALRRAVGAGNVVHAPEDLIAYEYDATIEHALPDAVVFPGTAEECAAVVRVANQFDVPVIPRGSGTGLAGGTLAVKGGVVVANPIPSEAEIPAAEIAPVIKAAVKKAEAHGIMGKETTPFLLAEIAGVTAGRSLAANIALVKHNAKIAAAIAVAFAGRAT